MAKRAIDTKLLINSVNDFSKLYNLDVATEAASVKKSEAEKTLIDFIKGELDKYEDGQD